MLDIIFQESTIYLNDFYVDSAFVERINELVETICVVNGTALRLPFHLARVRASCQTNCCKLGSHFCKIFRVSTRRDV